MKSDYIRPRRQEIVSMIATQKDKTCKLCKYYCEGSDEKEQFKHHLFISSSND